MSVLQHPINMGEHPAGSRMSSGKVAALDPAAAYAAALAAFEDEFGEQPALDERLSVQTFFAGGETLCELVQSPAGAAI